jgi:hypothetical protein
VERGREGGWGEGGPIFYCNSIYCNSKSSLMFCIIYFDRHHQYY